MVLSDPANAYPAKNKNVAWKVLEGEAVVLSLDSGVYFTLNATGTAVWERIDGATSLEEIGRGLCEQFDVPAEQATRDLLELTQALLDEGLISVTNDASTASGTQRA
jgi:hypothetical protein